MPDGTAIPTSQDLYSQMLGIQGGMPELQPLEPMGAMEIPGPSQTAGSFYQDLMQKAGGLRPEYEQLGQLESQAYATPGTEYADLDKRYGGEVGQGLGMGGEMGAMLGRLGSRYALADTQRRGIEALRGGIGQYAEDLASAEAARRQAEMERRRAEMEQRQQELQVAQMNRESERQRMMDRWGMTNTLYGQRLQQEALEEARRGGGGGGGGGGRGGGYGSVGYGADYGGEGYGGATDIEQQAADKMYNIMGGMVPLQQRAIDLIQAGPRPKPGLSDYAAKALPFMVDPIGMGAKIGLDIGTRGQGEEQARQNEIERKMKIARARSGPAMLLMGRS